MSPYSLRMENFDAAAARPAPTSGPATGPPPAAGRPYVIDLRQKVTMVKNVWGVFRVDEDGSEEQVAQVAQKRFKLKESVKVETPDGAPLLTIQARKVLELAATYDIRDAAGTTLATITKEFGKSLGRSTYSVSTPLGTLTVQERSAARAIMRRVWSVTDLPWFMPIQFDIVAQTAGGEHPVATIDRQMKLRDHYRISVTDPGLDWRLATAIGIATDAFMNR